jgi:hypothetical protein
MRARRMSHTPGPWIVVDQFGNEDEKGGLVGPVFGSPVAAITGYYYQTGMIANAKLIAAAPDLAEVLRETACVLDEITSVGREYQGHYNVAQVLVNARAALAKAGL